MDSDKDYFVGWFTLALINANIAQIKGRRGLSWFLASLLVGPVATFVLLFVEPVDPNSRGGGYPDIPVSRS